MRGRLLLVGVLLLSFLGCSSTYYSTMEKFGYHKRDLMVSRVKSAKESQEAAKDQFRSALEQFQQVMNFNGGKLQDNYDQLAKELERSELRAQNVRDRIESVENVSTALFKEWRGELEDYRNEKLKRLSEDKLDRTRARYEDLIGAMKRAESKIDPVLQPLRDNVLYLKHNLNAEAISSLESEVEMVNSNVGVLIDELEASIAESDRFIQEMDRDKSQG